MLTESAPLFLQITTKYDQPTLAGTLPSVCSLKIPILSYALGVRVWSCSIEEADGASRHDERAQAHQGGLGTRREDCVRAATRR